MVNNIIINRKEHGEGEGTKEDSKVPEFICLTERIAMLVTKGNLKEIRK